MNDPKAKTPPPPDDPPTGTGGYFPPGFQKLIYLRTPRRHRRDMLQEAWLAFLEGRDPSTAGRNYLAREVNREQHQTAFSQLSRKVAAECLDALALGRHRRQRRGEP